MVNSGTLGTQSVGGPVELDGADVGSKPEGNGEAALLRARCDVLTEHGSPRKCADSSS